MQHTSEISYIEENLKNFHTLPYVTEITNSKTYKKLKQVCQHDISDLYFTKNNSFYPNDRLSHCSGSAFIVYIANENTKKTFPKQDIVKSPFTFIKNNDIYKKEILTPDILKSELVTSFLHDCSHFCFSHSVDMVYNLYKFLNEKDKFETMFKATFQGVDLKYNSVHENLQHYVIKNDPNLQNYKFDKDSTLYSIDREKNFSNFKTSNLLTTDRMDYILRDSYSFNLITHAE